MGRQNEVSLPYFELDCRMDEKVKLIRAEYGLKGFAVVVMMYQHIYGGDHGYYCEWDDERLLLFMSDNGLIGESKNLINEVVSACIRRGIFSERLYKKYGILTSSGVQKQYLKATAKRQVVNLEKEYLLISVPENRSNVVVKTIDGVIKTIDVVINSQSKSRVENSKSIVTNNARARTNIESFEYFWCCYPLDKNRYLAEQAYISLVLDGIYTEDDLVESAKNYAEYCKITGTDKIYHANNFLKKCVFEDYLPGKYKKPERRKKEKNSSFDFEQHDYDFEEIERSLTEN